MWNFESPQSRKSTPQSADFLKTSWRKRETFMPTLQSLETTKNFERKLTDFFNLLCTRKANAKVRKKMTTNSNPGLKIICEQCCILSGYETNQTFFLFTDFHVYRTQWCQNWVWRGWKFTPKFWIVKYLDKISKIGQIFFGIFNIINEIAPCYWVDK